MARDLELGNFRAVKALPSGSHREAGLLRLLEHPSLPQMLDYTEQNGMCYIVMEYIRGKSLGQSLRDGYQFSLEEILEIGRTTAKVLAYLHSCRPAVFYGDLKPDNLIRTEDGRVYLVDFGSAVFEYGSSYRVTKGTPGYAAPEQFLGKITAASDQYGLGKTLEVLCGKKKWKYYAQCPALALFIKKCCMKNPEKRISSSLDAERILEKLHPLKLGLQSMLVLMVFSVLMLGITMRFGFRETSKKIPELNTVLTPVTARYYSLDYLEGSSLGRANICSCVEMELQKMLKVYGKSEEQIRILELLARNGEILNRADRAEVYYRQMLTYESGYSRGYLEYGLFLCRQERYAESRAVYHQWEKLTDLKERDESIENDKTLWETWKKDSGIILGKKM